MIIKIIVIALLLLSIGALASALFGLVSNKSDSNRTVRSLTYRIGLSVFAFLLLIISAHMGWIQPNSPFG